MWNVGSVDTDVTQDIFILSSQTFTNGMNWLPEFNSYLLLTIYGFIQGNSKYHVEPDNHVIVSPNTTFLYTIIQAINYCDNSRQYISF